MGIGNPHGYPDFTWPMVWVLQDAELWPIDQWVAKVGVQKGWYREVTVNAGTSNDTVIYTVPANKRLYVVSYTSGGQYQGEHILYRNGPLYLKAGWLAAYASFAPVITPPIILTTGQDLHVYFYNYGAGNGLFTATVGAYELDV